MSVKIILVDDHKLFLNGLESILKNELGIHVVGTATNGLELLELMEQHTPQIILTDIRMPIMDGIAITKLFQKKYPKTSIIALSMFDQEDDVVEMLDAGAKGYIIKNAEKEELVEAIHAVSKGGHYFSPKFKGIHEKWTAQEKQVKDLKLTRRERQILALLARGKTSQQMAKELNLSRFTIDTHRKNIHKKLGIKSNLILAKQAGKYLDDN
ncbi:response regulator transcription factor [Allomuricauda sp. SCSIO 65647]|uniref:response regulator transcription factor n=1 Tax=Allomuricauda sp. SCSIO 65647 TaxID=2908843 RepID=UPI001F376D41|nr:response regulator transcription factor [Muricauda sp. SCSIO 65647]UJH68423.1 response regulator transcription factor [Muricauda sp. SCSIO 65647]